MVCGSIKSGQESDSSRFASMVARGCCSTRYHTWIQARKGQHQLSKSLPRRTSRAPFLLRWPGLCHMATLGSKEISKYLAISGSIEEAGKANEGWKVENGVRLTFPHPVCLGEFLFNFQYSFPIPIIFHFENFQTFRKVESIVHLYAHYLDSTMDILLSVLLTQLYSSIHFSIHPFILSFGYNSK